MNTSKSHYCEEGGKFCLLFSLVFAGFRKGLSGENLLFGRVDISGIKQDSLQHHCFDTQGS